MQQHPNDEWLAALQGEHERSAELLEELRSYLAGALTHILKARALSADDIDDMTQEAMLRLLSYRHTFRGDARFTTWATTVATRVAFSRLRQDRARDDGQQAFEDIARSQADHSRQAPPEDALVRDDLLEALHNAIDEHLSERQRVAVLAELKGLPTELIAEQMDTNRNALYKLTHDARRRLREVLLEAGFTPTSLHELSTGRRLP